MMEQWTESEGFEPQIRARSNTWPLPKLENYADGDIKEENGTRTCATKPEFGDQVPASGTKKNPFRRNAWGNLSYADLIAQAIGSAPEQRLTLSQIYEWMVRNIPYFKDKGDSNSSAGWKNSIRHNLSLHNRFMRMQNTGHGKSSWWVINPDAKPGKATRRRAASMETKKSEKRRGRVRKKVEALGRGLLPANATPSPGSSMSDGLDVLPDSPLHSTSEFPLSPGIRPRASSSASSCSKLSPIPGSEFEWTGSDLHPSLCVREHLAGDLAEGVKLRHEALLQGSFTNSETPEPEFRIGPGASPYGTSKCPLSDVGCALPQYQRDSILPNGLALSGPQREPSPESLSGSGYPRAVQSSTMMGQLMGALNNSTTLDDLNLGMETFHEGFDCNVDEVIRHELLLEGSLDFNFSHSQVRFIPGGGGEEKMSLVGGQTLADSSSKQLPNS